ncbi:MAG: hypothetical protein IT329_01520, partial [Caldilineaceae bacterium]|nr:hypothetical protein [Caldilineaceae bacterium]
ATLTAPAESPPAAPALTGTPTLTGSEDITTTDVITGVEEAAEIIGEAEPPPSD